MSKISIIGCGWLGLPLGGFLLEKGYTIYGSTTSKEKLSQLSDLGIRPFLIKANQTLEGEDLEDFFNSEILIINIPPGRRRPDVENLHFTELKNIMNAAINGSIQKVIFCGSTGVYPNNNTIITEESPTNPSTNSTKALVRFEKYFLAQSDVQKTILRFSGLVGGNRKAGRFLAGKENVPNGDAPVNLVHRKDCINVIYEVIRKEAWGTVFNVCSDEHPLRKDFYIQQTSKQGLTPPTFIKNDVPSFKIISNEKLKRELKYTFLYPDPSQF